VEDEIMSSLIKNGILQVKDIFGIPFKVDLVPVGTKMRPGYSMIADYITCHNTGNSTKGADEYLHTSFVDNSGKYVSWHFTVGANMIFQEIPINENAWHAGDGRSGTGNRKSLSAELCEVGGDWLKIRENGLKLFVWLMFNVDSLINDNWYKTIVPHQKWSGKYCPRIILSEKGGFKRFQDDGYAMMQKYRNKKIKPTIPTTIGIDFIKLEKIIKQDLDDNYWIKNLTEGTLTRFDIILIINKLAGEININKALDKFEKNGWTNNKKYWLNVANGGQRYSRVFLNSLINNALKTL